jgi:T-complex protein 1 subunit beta
MDTDKIKIFGARLKASSTTDLASFERAERAKMASKVSSILSSGCNVFVNRQLVYNYPENLMAEKVSIFPEH